MGNRKQPFGYRIENGQLTVNHQEAEAVQVIFECFRDGASLQTISGQLNAQTIPYDTDKRWNKNAVARVLADERYTGAKGYPSIIESETFADVQQKRESKQCNVQKTAAQKVLRQLCRQSVTLQIEQAVLALLNNLVHHPEHIHCPAQPLCYPAEVAQAQEALDAELAEQTVGETAARQAIFTLAAAQYAAIGAAEYETRRLQRLFASQDYMQQLDAEVLRTAVKDIQITGRSTVRVQLKNGQIFGT